jgi:hypothetical protein
VPRPRAKSEAAAETDYGVEKKRPRALLPPGPGEPDDQADVLTEEEEIGENFQMTQEDFLAIVTHSILDGQQRYIALCAAAPQEMPAKDELLQIVNGTVETIVRAAGEVPAAERAEAVTKAAAIIVNLSFARIGSIFESQFDVAEHRRRSSTN